MDKIYELTIRKVIKILIVKCCKHILFILRIFFKKILKSVNAFSFLIPNIDILLVLAFNLIWAGASCIASAAIVSHKTFFFSRVWLSRG